MNHRGPPGAEPAGTLALFPSEAAWARTRVLDAQAVDTCDFDLDAFARYRRIRILTYSSSVQMLHTVLERFAESHVECVLGYSRVVSNVASIIALQTAAIEEVHNVLRGLPASSRDDVLDGSRRETKSGCASGPTASGTRISSGGTCPPTCCTSMRAARRSSCSMLARSRPSLARSSPPRAGGSHSGSGQHGRQPARRPCVLAQMASR